MSQEIRLPAIVMRTIESSSPPAEILPASGKPLRIVIVYEDLPARLRMQNAFWMLTRKLSKEYDFECFWYGFSELNHSRVAARAQVAAVAADLILFSVNVETEPPESVKSWIESWIELKATQDAAMAALLNRAKRPGKHKMRIWTYLNYMAQRAGMSFLPEIIGTGRLCGQAL